jgi:alpha-L-fucosidase
VEELMTGYGHIDVLWLDGGQVRPPSQDIRMDKLAAMARSHQPGLIVADRTVGGPHENIVTPEQEIPDKPLGVPWESCMTLGNSWKYVSNDPYKSPRRVIHMLAETAAKGGNLLLGIGPDPLGVIPAEAASRLREVGQWMQVNGEAIHGTRPVPPYQSGNVRFTTKAPYTYAIVLGVEGEEQRGRQISIGGVQPEAGSEVGLLGRAKPVRWEATNDGFLADLPKDAPDSHAWVLRFRRKEGA